MEEEIKYYLKLLNFLRNEEFDDETLQRCVEYLDKPKVLEPEPTAPVFNPPNEILECNDEIIKLALLRDEPRGMQIEGNNICYNKKKYNFNNVFQASDESIVYEMLEFINKRTMVNKDSSVITFGYSGSGKSTLIRKLIENIGGIRFKLYEIYLNKIYIYLNGLKVEIPIKDLDSDKYIFESYDILNVCEKFARRKDNGVNSTSSRSHTVLELYYPNCKVSLFDLAGNEKINKKEQVDEAKFINNSLFNVSRYLKLGPKHKDNKCMLLNVIKKTANIIFTMLLHDNGANSATNHLLMFSDILKLL